MLCVVGKRHKQQGEKTNNRWVNGRGVVDVSDQVSGQDLAEFDEED